MTRFIIAAVTAAAFGLVSVPCVANDQAGKAAPDWPGAHVEVYKRVGDVALNMYIVGPQDRGRNEEAVPAVVFFFGGGWNSGTPRQFQEHCRYFAARGMVAMAADYRVASRHGVKAVDCVSDARSAVRWIRRNAKRLGVDPDRIVASGGSAGGHLAASTGVIASPDQPTEEIAISSIPNALALFNPVLATAPIDDKLPQTFIKEKYVRKRLGVAPKQLSPYHHVRAGAPPTIIFHGKADATVPYWTAQGFTERMQKAGNRCELVGYDDQGHGFFNSGRGGNLHYVNTVRAMDRFLGSLGYLNGEPTLGDQAEER